MKQKMNVTKFLNSIISEQAAHGAGGDAQLMRQCFDAIEALRHVHGALVAAHNKLDETDNLNPSLQGALLDALELI